MKEITKPIPTEQKAKKKFVDVTIDEQTWTFRKPSAKEYYAFTSMIERIQTKGTGSTYESMASILATCCVAGSFEELSNEYPGSLAAVFAELQSLLGGDAVITVK